MALTHTIGKVRGASQSLTLMVDVHNEDPWDTTPIEADDVVTHINGAGDIPTTILGVPDDGDPSLDQVSATLWRVGIRYRIASLRALHPPLSGEERSGFNFHLPRKFVDCIDPADMTTYWNGVGSPPLALKAGGAIYANFATNGSGWTSGIWLEPPASNLQKTLSVPIGTVTGSWVRGIAAIVGGGYVNSTSLTSGAYAAGEVIITHIIGIPISESLFQIDIGWNWAQNVTNETRGNVTGIDYDGHDVLWPRFSPGVDRETNMMSLAVPVVIACRVRPRTDISAIGISPP